MGVMPARFTASLSASFPGPVGEEGAVPPDEEDVTHAQALVPRSRGQAREIVQLEAPLAQELQHVDEDGPAIVVDRIELQLGQDDFRLLQELAGPREGRDLVAFDVELEQGPIRSRDAWPDQRVERGGGTFDL